MQIEANVNCCAQNVIWLVKWSWVLVTSTHVIHLLKCALVVWPTWLVSISHCSNQSTETTIKRGWDGWAVLKTGEGEKGSGWALCVEWRDHTRQYSYTLMTAHIYKKGHDCNLEMYSIELDENLSFSQWQMNSFQFKVFTWNRQCIICIIPM